MKELSKRLAAISKDAEPERLQEARVIIAKLRSMNMRWNIDGLTKFLRAKQKELFFNVSRASG